MTKKFRIKRRTLLRGAAGAAIGLPMLNLMEDPSAARADGTDGPCRFVMGYAGGTSLGHNADSFRPDREGRGYDLKRSLDPLGAGERADGFYD